MVYKLNVIGVVHYFLVIYKKTMVSISVIQIIIIYNKLYYMFNL
ncbi:hypothetical protein IX330_002818 [Bacteroides pyogenes]|nr:hypothetical protein [Bacteroides pyogenes]MBR8739836.1 hypothetical protein [Bacteroides pyogenes]MBR8755754.1 hypothetical protein [Bacteroides pyogenes]MBR8794020.1 hypothetical protein [Bacteroides pyogenes]MBR8810487.1 hypothetical protein [Bacteroides pyogenes]